MSIPVAARGALRSLGGLFDDLGTRNVFIVASPSAISGAYAGPILKEALQGRKHTIYSGFGKGPDIQDVEAGTRAFESSGADCLLAIGGGTPMDFAKLINVHAANADPFASMTARRAPLIAVPTTCGTGSEATPFAVVYKDRIKHSLESAAFMLPDRVILDPALLDGLPPAQIAVTGLDALSQSVESYWSVNSTEASRSDSAAALELIHANLLPAFRTRHQEALAAMLEAAHLSGKAIAVAKTTASHAMSYPLTAFHGVPHGHAVALTLGELLVHNRGVTGESCWDPRGPEHVRATLDAIIALLGATDAEGARQALKTLMRDLGLATRLTSLGVRTTEDVRFLMSNGINPQRLRNNPRALCDTDIEAILTSVL